MTIGAAVSFVMVTTAAGSTPAGASVTPSAACPIQATDTTGKGGAAIGRETGRAVAGLAAAGVDPGRTVELEAQA
jgi:hypothetical protein